jgi:hypothetical protein
VKGTLPHPAGKTWGFNGKLGKEKFITRRDQSGICPRTNAMGAAWVEVHRNRF